MAYDAIVIGGGIVGAGILRDCALRGLKAVLLEKGEPGHGTTGASTHLIHGGLRYLLYDRLTTHTTCWDSGNIVRIARPLLTRLPILWPVYRDHDHGPEMVETLMESYDYFSGMKEGLPHLRLPAEETLRLAPGLKADGLIGSLAFDEWWVDAVELVRANLRAAEEEGAEVRPRTAVVGFLRENQAVRGVEIEQAGGKRDALRAPVVINAAGPWVDQIASLAGIRIPLRLQKGTHLIYDRPLLKTPEDRPLGLLLEAEGGGRYVFAIAIRGKTWVGPTDLPTRDDPDAVKTDSEEIRYLVASMRRYFKDFPEQYDRTIVGARPILGQRGVEKLLSREFEILEHRSRDQAAGFVTAAGGKMSDFRLMAQEAVDAACRELGRNLPCATHVRTLDGQGVGVVSDFRQPWRPLKKFLRRHPHLREGHALAYLGAGLLRHLGRRAAGAAPLSTAADFQRRYWS